MSWKSEFVHNYKSREVDNIEDESKVERKIRFSPSVKVKLFKDDECIFYTLYDNFMEKEANLLYN